MNHDKYEMCGAIEEAATHRHTCIGEAGHARELHWCALGHVWADDDPEETA